MALTADKVAGVVAEYNPFHNGHLRHLEKTMALTGAGACVAVMSGDFVQRGEPALLDKWKRAEAAVRNGVDLVVELPFLYACNSAEYFARGAVKTLDAMGIVTHLSFGSEVGDVAALRRVAGILAREADDFKEGLRAASKAGLSFPAARCEAVRGVAGDEAAELLKGPNNILGVEYLKQMMASGSRMEPVTFRRHGAGYFEADPQSGTAGASALRRLLLAGEWEAAAAYVPDGAASLCRPPAEGFMSIDRFYHMIAYAARVRRPEELRGAMSASEGLENRLKKALASACGASELIAATKSKRYTETRVKRLLFHVLLGASAEEFHELDGEPVGYLRALAMNGKGRKLINAVRKASPELALITNLNRHKPEHGAAARMLAYDVLAADIYSLAARGSFREGSDYRARPYIAE
jgi:predicted nucleotidyltransferase